MSGGRRCGPGRTGHAPAGVDVSSRKASIASGILQSGTATRLSEGSIRRLQPASTIATSDDRQLLAELTLPSTNKRRFLLTQAGQDGAGELAITGGTFGDCSTRVGRGSPVMVESERRRFRVPAHQRDGRASLRNASRSRGPPTDEEGASHRPASRRRQHRPGM